MKVELIDHMGSDLCVVNAARVSFDKESKWDEKDDGTIIGLKEADKRLIRFLARGMTADDFEGFIEDVRIAGIFEPGWAVEDREHLKEILWQWRRTPTHFAPFAHPHVTFRIKAPIFVARQLSKHQVGMVWSEVSRRYVDSEPEFFTPDVWRKKAENVKQGSSEEAVELDWLQHDVNYYAYEMPLQIYNNLLDAGVCPEQARMVLPQSMMTEWIWTGSLYGWANVYNQRKPGSHAQKECEVIAEQISEHMGRLFPVSWEALTDVT